jgi:hypothetical protein
MSTDSKAWERLNQSLPQLLRSSFEKSEQMSLAGLGQGKGARLSNR